MPPRDVQPGRYSINKYTNVKRPEGQTCAKLGTGYLARDFRPRVASRPVTQYHYFGRIGGGPLYEQQYGGTKLLSTGVTLELIPLPTNSLTTAKFPDGLTRVVRYP